MSSIVQRFTITNKAAKVRSGILVTYERSLYYDQIRDVSLQRGVLDMIFETGTILIDTGRVESTYHSYGSNRAAILTPIPPTINLVQSRTINKYLISSEPFYRATKAIFTAARWLTIPRHR